MSGSRSRKLPHKSFREPDDAATMKHSLWKQIGLDVNKGASGSSSSAWKEEPQKADESISSLYSKGKKSSSQVKKGASTSPSKGKEPSLSTSKVKNGASTSPSEEKENIPKEIKEEDFLKHFKTDYTHGASYKPEDCHKYKQFMKLISKKNSFSYLRPTPDYETAVQEFLKFLKFVENAETVVKLQLARVIFPVFVYLYLTMLQIHTDSSEQAHAFFRQFDHIFHTAENYDEVLKDLYSVESIKDVKDHVFFNRFWEYAVVVKLCPHTLEVVKTFFEKIESTVLLQIFHFRFYYASPGDRNYTDEEYLEIAKRKLGGRSYRCEKSKQDQEKEPSNKKKSRPVKKSSKVTSNSSADTTQKEKTIPLVSNITLDCRKSKICAVDINKEDSELCASLTDSRVYVLPLVAFKNKKGKVSVRDQHVTSFSFDNPVKAVRYIPTQPHSLLASCEKDVVLLNTQTKSRKYFMQEHGSNILDIDAHVFRELNKSFFATAGSDGLCCLWDLNKSKVVHRYVGHENSVNIIRFHPNGRYVVTGSADTRVYFWGLDSVVPLRFFGEHSSEIKSVAFSSAGKMIASADSLGSVIVWDINDNCKICDVGALDYKYAEVTSLCFADDMLAVSDNKGIVRIWDIKYLKASVLVERKFPEIPVFVKCNKFSTWRVVLQSSKKSKIGT